MSKQRQPLIWEEYSRAPQILDADVDAAEEALGFKFPEDYRVLLLDHQGQTLNESGPNSVQVPKHHFLQSVGRIVPVRAMDRRRTLVESQLQRWERGFPGSLVRFADGLGQKFFALDYHQGKDAAPTVVYENGQVGLADDLAAWASGSDPLVRVYGEFDAPYDPAHDVWFTVFHVADSITEFLEKLQKSDA